MPVTYPPLSSDAENRKKEPNGEGIGTLLMVP